jgi:uncharacterized protein
VGVDLNTASRHLLEHVSGIGPALADAIVSHRQERGLFPSRQALLEVPRFGAKAFEQAAGFLRVPGSANTLDNTGVHPERYQALKALAEKLGKKVEDLVGTGVELVREAASLKDELGEWTYADVLRELEKPGRDPRATFTPFAFREDVRALEDLKPGMTCPGIVTNVTNFGAFVDVGVHHDGLVHISQLGERFVKDPREAVKPGDRVEVRVLKVDLDKRQISLTMHKSQPERPRRGPKERRPPKGAARPQATRPPRPQAPAAPPKGQERRPERPSSPPRGAKPGPKPPPPAPPPRAKPAFNNPFAVLARLKDPGKS